MDNAILVNDEVELTLLSMLLREGDSIFSVANKIQPEMFSTTSAQELYRSIRSVAMKGLFVSRLIVKTDLMSRRLFDKIGGEEYLTEVMLHQYDTGSIGEYARILLECYKNREIVTLGSQIQASVGKYEPDAIISKVFNRLEKITSVGSSDVVNISDLATDYRALLQSRIDNPGVVGVTTGFPKLDAMTIGYRPGEIWYLGARPSMGKTAFMLSSLLATSLSGTPVLLVNREMSKEAVMDRLCSMSTRIPLQKIRMGTLNQSEHNAVKSALDMVQSIPFYIDDNWRGDDSYIVSTVRKYAALKGIRVLALDYIQLMVERSDQSTHELGRMSRMIKMVAGEVGATALILSQLSRGLESRPDKRPLMSDLRQSGNLEEDADIMAGLYRDEVYVNNSPKAGIMEFIIRKARNGPIGLVDLCFDNETVYVYDPTNGPRNYIAWS